MMPMRLEPAAPQSRVKHYTTEPLRSLDKRVLVASLDMIISNQQITKALIRLPGCAGWSAPVLFAKPRKQVFLQQGPFLVRFDSIVPSQQSSSHVEMGFPELNQY